MNKEETTFNIKEIRKVKEVVLKVLSTDDRARNDDMWLTLKCLQEMDFKIYIDYKDLERMPKFETFKRVRAWIQNRDKMFLPTSEDVVRRRKTRRKCFKEVNSL